MYSNIGSDTKPLPLIMRHPVRWVALIAISAPFVQYVATRLMDLNFAVAEMERAGLLPPAPMAAADIVVKLGCSIFILSGFFRWIGALVLCVVTLVSAIGSHDFWNSIPGADRIASADAFTLQISLAGGLLLIAWYDLHLWRTRTTD